MRRLARSFFVLTIAIIMCCQAMHFALAEEMSAAEWLAGDTASDAVAVKYEEDISVLSALGATDGLSLSLAGSTIMNRAEFLALVMNIENNRNRSSVNNYSGFTDVRTGDWYAWAVYTAAQKGIINGSGGGMFSPNEPISYESAIKILVGLLGYAPIAEDTGGFPSGYIKQASNLKITDEAPEDEQAMTAAECAHLIVNAMNTDVLGAVSYGETVRYEARENMTWLKRSMNTERLDGTVDANEYTALFNTDGTREGEISVDGAVYKLACDADVFDILGKEIEFYLEDEETIVYIYAPSVKTETILSQDIKGVTGRVIEYYLNEKVKSADIPKDTAVIYNNVAYPDYDSDVFNVKNGKIELLKNKSGRIMGVKITEILPIYVSAVDTAKCLISDEIAHENVDYSDCLSINVYDSTGELTELSKVKIGVVLDMLISSDKRRITAYISENKVTGKISEINTENSPNLVINGSRIEISSLASFTAADLNAGADVTLYLDTSGKAVYLKDLSVTSKYAYMIAARTDGVLSSKFTFKMYDVENGVRDVQSSSRFKLNDSRVKNFDILPPTLSEAGPVIYSTDQTGRVTEIYTADAQGSSLIKIANETTYTFYPAGGNYIFASDSESAFSASFCVNDTSLLYRIPNNPIHAETNDFVTEKPVGFSSSERHKVTAYGDKSNPDLATILVEKDMTGDTSSILLRSSAVIVSQKSEAINGDGESTSLLTVTGKSVKNKQYYTVDDSIAEDIEVGDLILIGLNSNEEIYAIRKIIDYCRADESGNTEKCVIDSAIAVNSRWYSDLCLFRGYIYSNDDGMVRLAKQGTNPDEISGNDTMSFNTRNIAIIEIDGDAPKSEQRVVELEEKAIPNYAGSGMMDNCILYVSRAIPCILMIYK